MGVEAQRAIPFALSVACACKQSRSAGWSMAVDGGELPETRILPVIPAKAEIRILLVIPAKAEIRVLLVIPAKAGIQCL